MQLLFMTDTHGDLRTINELAAKTGADAVIHAGDFGFYDGGSCDRLTERELRLRVIHSHLEDAEKRAALQLPPPELKRLVEETLPLSDLPAYLSGQEEFSVPVYAVWGNHEDVEVVKGFHRGELQVPNLHLLCELGTFRLGRCRIFGLGGNLLMGKKFFQNVVAGGGGKVWSTLSQYLQLLTTVEEQSEPDELRIFVSHVSPGKEPFISLVGAHARTDLLVSGHMGPPSAITWNEFAIRSDEEAVARLAECASEVQEDYLANGRRARDLVPADVEGLAAFPDETVRAGRGRKFPRWYREMFYVNLPDAAQGYAVATVRDDAFELETFRSRTG